MQLKRYKKTFQHSYSFGVFTTLELLQQHPEQVSKIVVSEKGSRNVGIVHIETLCSQHNIPVEISDRSINRLSPKESHLVVGVFNKYDAPLDASTNHVVLVNPGDMGNLGTILRTMLGFGMRDLVVIQPAADLFDPKTIRASMGALFHIRYHYVENIEQYQQLFSHQCYAFMTDANRRLADTQFIEPFALIFGNESQGLTAAFHQISDSIRIPFDERVDSLNLAVTVGIALYTATRL